MKVNIIATGSKCNCVLATFSDDQKVIFDFGEGALEKCCQRNMKMLPIVDLTKIDNVLITHSHRDHCGDFEKIQGKMFKKSLNVKDFEVLHDVPNKGFVVMNDATKEGFVYATDYYEIPEKSFDFLLKLFGFKSWKWMAMLELSYCKWLYEKLPDNQKFGLGRHCSDVQFFHYAKKIFEVNPAVNIISVHASGRQSEYLEGVSKFGSVCPPDHLRKEFYRIFKGKPVRFGHADFGANFNYI